jgi:invasion protein IalB
MVLALYGQSALGREAGSGTADQGSFAPSTALKYHASKPSGPAVAQSNPPAQTTPQAGATLPPQRTETINFDNWIVTCRELLDGPKKRNCSAAVAVTRSENGQTVFALSIQPNDQGRLMALLQTPTGVAIAPGVDVKLDNVSARKFAFDYCEPARCVASLPADSAFVRDLAVATKIAIVTHSSDGKPVSFEFAIKGFDKAYANMTKG